MIISIALGVLLIVDNWFIYKKMGREGWEAIVPFYNNYVLFDVLYGNGWKFLTILIPLYNIYVAIKLNLDLAKVFNKGTGFGIGLLFLPYVFMTMLAFGSYTFLDGRYANNESDIFTKAADVVGSAAQTVSQKVEEVKTKKVCPNCGQELKADQLFCPSCGTKYEPPKKRFCSNCGNELKEGEVFCGKCGTRWEH